jgi:hypothetical protein
MGVADIDYNFIVCIVWATAETSPSYDQYL